MAAFKEKLEKLFKNSASCIADPVLDIAETSSHKLMGLIVSNSFLDMDQLDRQNKIWNYLEGVLKPEELGKIVSLVTVTPEEANNSVD